MSWHTSGVLIHADFSDDFPGLLEKLGVSDAERQDEPISFEDATSVSMEGLGVACVDGWTCLFSSLAVFLIDSEALAKIAKKADVFTFTLEGSSGAAGFEWLTGGKSVRRRMVVEGDVTVDTGKPLAVEKKIFAKEEDDEQRVLLLMEALTVPFESLSKARFTMFDCGDGLDELAGIEDD
jgi:hypothetical protein